MASSSFSLSKFWFYVVLLIAVLWMYQGCKGCRRNTKNANSSTLLRLGMSLAEAMKIMGTPDRVEVKTDTVVFTYFSGGFFVSDASIFLDTSGRIIQLWTAH